MADLESWSGETSECDALDVWTLLDCGLVDCLMIFFFGFGGFGLLLVVYGSYNFFGFILK